VPCHVIGTVGGRAPVRSRLDGKRRRGAGTISSPAPLDQIWRSTIIFLISAMALAGLSPFGQVLAQFMIVWQR